MSKQTALYPGNEERVGYWFTPPDLMAELHAEFDFDFDACPHPRSAGFDGLTEPWGQRTWCNPPHRGPKVTWVRKALKERSQGKLVVMALDLGNCGHAPDLLADGVAEVRIRNIRWLNPEGERGRSRPVLFFILRPRP